MAATRARRVLLKRSAQALQASGRRGLARLDAWMNSLYGWRFNPLYHSGALVVACFAVVSVTGLYLLLFYRIGSPYASVVRIDEQVLAGRWIRSLHRYASDLAVAAALVHAFRMGVQSRTWGPRVLAWVSGVILLGVFFVCGWTGFVMVWDVQGQLIAAEGARVMDVLPIFSEPLSRTFVGERAIPSAFFFLNLFAHIAIPVGILLILWIHVSRLARTYLWPPRELFLAAVAALTVLSVVWPAALAPEADLLRIPGEVPLDVFYAFWLPISRALPAGWAWAAILALVGGGLAVPALTRPEPDKRPPPSWVNARFCTGCEQCYHDCPYEAIAMVPRDDGRDGYVALVDPLKCVSCGICSGSCAPMGVGPPGRTGRDQLDAVRALIAARPPGPDDVVLVGCHNAAAGWGAETFAGKAVHPVSCVGSLHTSVIEYLIRAGAGGVLVVACPPRDCWNREGGKWMEERLYHEREAELKERVDRRRLRIVHAGEGEGARVVRELVGFEESVRTLERSAAEASIEVDVECETPEVSVAEEAGR